MHFSVSTPAVLPVLPVRSDVDEPSELDVMLDVLLERFVLMSHYYTNLVCADGFRRLEQRCPRDRPYRVTGDLQQIPIRP